MPEYNPSQLQTPKLDVGGRRRPMKGIKIATTYYTLLQARSGYVIFTVPFYYIEMTLERLNK